VLNKSQISAFERTNLAVWDYPITDRYTKLYMAMEDAGFPATIEDAVARVKRSYTGAQFAYIGDASGIRYLEMTNCDLQAVGPEFSRKPYAIAVQKGSPWKDAFDRRLVISMSEKGQSLWDQYILYLGF
jgi:glutamate receptor, ionotropic, invertebrate